MNNKKKKKKKIVHLQFCRITFVRKIPVLIINK